MAQPRYSQALKLFIRQWSPNNPELNQRFIESVKELLAAILNPPEHVIDVSTILTPSGGKTIVRLGDFEAQLDPLEAQHLGLSLIEASTAARTETFLSRFLTEKLEVGEAQIVGMIGAFRDYRIEEMEKELAGGLEQRNIPPDRYGNENPSTP